MDRPGALDTQEVFYRLAAPNQLVTEVPLKQVDDTHFTLTEGFVYRGAAYRPDVDDPFEVNVDGLGRTDLASIPKSLRWFVGTYGKHTLAALLHDYLVQLADALRTFGAPEQADVDRTRGDLVFRIALGELGVPLVRQWVMWTAVTLASRMKSGRGKLVMWAWLVAASLGTSLFVFGLGSGRYGFMWAAIGPLAFAPLWGRQWNAGLIGGLAFVAMAPPTLLVLGVYWLLYMPLEAVLRLVRKLRDPRGDIPGPQRYRRL